MSRCKETRKASEHTQRGVKAVSCALKESDVLLCLRESLILLVSKNVCRLRFPRGKDGETFKHLNPNQALV